MRLRLIRDLIAHARREPKPTAVGKLGLQLSGETEEDVSLLAPVVREIARRILHHPDAHVAELPAAPARGARFAWTDSLGDRGPVSSAEGDVGQAHGYSIHVSARLARRSRASPSEDA